MSVRIGVDIGGTFTDVVAHVDGDLVVAKTPTSYPNPSEGIVLALETVLSKAGVDPGEVVALLHGTTVATNALITRRGAKAALVTTAGFRDVLVIGRADRDPRGCTYSQLEEPVKYDLSRMLTESPETPT